jgi:GNAT superfamily N-acetyltransferase
VITIAPAQVADVEAIAHLLDELNGFYGGIPSEPLDTRMSRIHEALFGPTPAGTALLAWDDGELAGFASYNFLWPASGLTRSLYLKELYVAEAYRRGGVGTWLMHALREVGRAHQCSRMEWTTDSPNSAAQAFYENLGFKPNPSKIFYRSAL